MQNLRAAFVAAMTLVAVFTNTADAAWDKPWKSEDRALVVDAYEFNPIDWKELASDKRIAGFINKASDGLAPEWNCNGKSGDDELLCKNRWWKYSVTKELYMTRRTMAKTLGLKWGAYHLGRPGNPREQADHFIDFAEPDADDLIALDIEDNTDEWMSLADAEIFANQIKIRTGRYPVLYTNGSTAKWISDYRETYPLLSRLPLWYARYRDDITGLFPETTWPTYALWQFSSMHNCSSKQCPYRVKGAKHDIDVNVSAYDVAGLRAAWPFNELITPLDTPAAPSLVASLKAHAGKALAALTEGLIQFVEARELAAAPAAVEVAVLAKSEPLVAAYGATEHQVPRIDPLQLITATADAERADARKADHPVAAATPKLLVPGGPVQVAALGSLDGLTAGREELSGPALPLAGTSPRGPSLGAAATVRFRQWLQASEAGLRRDARLRQAAYMAVAAKDDLATSPRGSRLGAATRRGAGASGVVALEQRIAIAFVATR